MAATAQTSANIKPEDIHPPYSRKKRSTPLKALSDTGLGQGIPCV
jgi:hypothetical protein